MRVTMKYVKDFAFRQMDGMWHDGSGLATTNMVKFIFKKYVVVNPWMNETTQRKVNPYKYYGKKRTKRFIRRAVKVIQRDREIEKQHRR